MTAFKNTVDFVKETLKRFQENGVIHYAASLSYYTIFSLPPILIIVITVAGSVFGEEAIKGEIYNQFKDLLGESGAIQVQNIVDNALHSSSGRLMRVVGIIALLFASTGIFIVIQETLNNIWGVRPRPKSGILKLLFSRLLSFGMVLVISFLLLVFLLIHAVLLAFSDFIDDYLLDVSVVLIQVLNQALSLGIITLLFAMIFKILPDIKIKWNDVWLGAFVTALLFTLGKILIGLYLGNTNIGNAYGAAGAVVILLIWVQYSSLLLFLGAELTHSFYLKKYGRRVRPSSYAVWVERKTIDPKQLTIEGEE